MDFLFLEPRATYDKFIVGVGEGVEINSVVLVYDKQKIIKHLTMECEELALEDGRTAEEIAVEYFDYNILKAYSIGAHPIFVDMGGHHALLEQVE